jgi:NADH-quinone oxidoreductase subunit F
MKAGNYLLLRHRDIPNLRQLEVYQANGGFEAFRKVVTSMQPAEALNEVKASGLRGRGGAGFPTGKKWSFLPDDLWPHYVVANADESEPGTFKDREILENNPFQFLEGLMIACYTVSANTAYIYIRGEFFQIARELDRRISELEAAGLLGKQLFGTNYNLRLYTHLGAGAYVCGEETALLESIEGKLGQPRLRPPYPASSGLFGKPTVINNVETLTNVPLILKNGAAWYHSMGTGVKIFSLSGCVNRPGNYELPLGTTFRHLIYDLGDGIPAGRKIKAIMPAGASSKLIVADDRTLDAPMDYESLAQLGSSLGSASVIILDESVNIAWLIGKTIRFYECESCGKCTPCREGTRILIDTMEKINCGEGESADLDILLRAADTMTKASLCGLGQAAPNLLASALRNFRPEFESYMVEKAGSQVAL